MRLDLLRGTRYRRSQQHVLIQLQLERFTSQLLKILETQQQPKTLEFLRFLRCLFIIEKVNLELSNIQIERTNFNPGNYVLFYYTATN